MGHIWVQLPMCIVTLSERLAKEKIIPLWHHSLGGLKRGHLDDALWCSMEEFTILDFFGEPNLGENFWRRLALWVRKRCWTVGLDSDGVQDLGSWGYMRESLGADKGAISKPGGLSESAEKNPRGKPTLRWDSGKRGAGRRNLHKMDQGEHRGGHIYNRGGK